MASQLVLKSLMMISGHHLFPCKMVKFQDTCSVGTYHKMMISLVFVFKVTIFYPI